MTKRADRIVVLLFALFLGAFFLLNLAIPDKEESDQENRRLQTLPEFSFRSLFAGRFTMDFESYCSDQFVGRDGWVSLKARLELLQGKKENNGIYLCEGERLIEPFAAPSAAELDRRVQIVNTLGENVDVPVTLALIPTAAELYAELLPKGAPNDSEREIIDYLYSSVISAGTVDLLSPLSAHREEDLFYRTDHHWTSLGAFRGYEGLAEPLGFLSRERSAYTEKTVSDSFRGTACSSSGFFWVSPDTMEIFREPPEGLTVEKHESGAVSSASLYEESMLLTKDKYRFFLGGNTPRAVLRTGNQDLPSLLILRDSYADSLAPFLLDHFSEIHLLDLRYYRGSVQAYISDNDIDQVLILYSVSNFCTDTNLALMTR